jgi:predicted metal-binding protein
MTKIGIIICDRYRTCAGGKCLRALRSREGGFSRYRDTDVELVGYATCGGCPGGNVEDAPAEMKRNGAQVIHLATGMVVVSALPVAGDIPQVHPCQVSARGRRRDAPCAAKLLRDARAAGNLGLPTGPGGDLADSCG